MKHIRRNICLMAVSCVLLASAPTQSMAQTGRTARTQASQNQKITVSGTVLDKTTNEPLIGVSVVVKGVANAGTITDMDGKFTLKLPYAEAPLVFSYLGYQPQEIIPGAKKELTVLLQEDTKALQEVVVVGYTKQRKETMVGSVATITTKDLTQSPTANINNALAGRLPGLVVNQYAGGEPGVDQSELFIRGKATYGNQSAIVIVDGIERDMSYLAPDEIETFTILKDASATAAYGIRGANGVIVITTKRGKAAEKATVNLKASIGINQPIGFPEYLGSADYATLYNEARLNDAKMTGADVSSLNLFSQQAIDNFRRAKGDNSDGLGYDWDYYDFAFKPGMQEDVSLSIRGGTDKVRYYVLANYFSQGGNYKYSDAGEYDSQTRFTRYNFRSNIDININRYLSTRLDLGARITDRNAPGTTAGRLMTICATQPPYLPILVEENSHPQNEEYIQQNSRGMLYGDNIYRYNILGELSRTGYLNEKNTYLNGSFAMNLDMGFLTKGLKAEIMFSYDASEGRWINRKLDTYKDGYREYPKYATFMPIEGSDAYMEGGHYTGAYKTGNKYDIDQTIGNGFSHNASDGRTYIQARVDYNRVFKDRHEVTAMLLANRGNRTVNNELAYHSQGITGRFAYYYNQKYLMEFNCGYNGSENFAPGKRYGFFPAGSIGWVISEEPFMKKASWIDFLKVRASYGLVGSDNVSSRFPYLAFYGGGSGYHFGNNFGTEVGGTSEGNLANENLTWEKARKLNVGIDFTTLNQRLALTVDAFYEYRFDIITDMNGDGIMGYPDIVGKDAALQNLGEVSNRGVDVELSWNDKIGKDFRYYIRPNLTFSRNRLEYKAEVARKNSWRKETGKRLYENFVYVFDHFVANQDEADRLNKIGYQPWGQLIPGDVVYKDLDRNGVIDDEDRTAMGNPRSPELMFGIPFGFQYKNFDFSVLLQGATNTSILLNGAAVFDFPQFEQDKIGRVKKMHLDRWTPETAATAKYPALHYGTHDNNKNGNSSLFLYDASYLRLKNVEIGYNVSPNWLRKFHVQQARIYVQGLNLLTFDKLGDVDIDPETKSGDGASWYPIQKVFNFGIDITF
ncbi:MULTISPECIES: SusC/RagA family TonB-linked outer membrane protein [Bacteroides]|jgi:tonB-linked outer membrane protein, susC/ragA family|uniref:TonB-dependent receptor n=4 Tax=Bacteroides TaxID=816 RepID=A0ABT5H5F5_9BACE|nr:MULTISPECIES: TonB-dependent receptor [Bacteroides]MCG4683669.1 TonB-dependent receptor [Bacteroides finegoldii]MDC7135827.1 TonB-dependent receptor [Bacteroides zhangwenhongii]OKZ23326.1 MAG: SusC/RagA family TonB-linked outer membrane protein [Bacteroides finegoldii]CUO67194.1 Outer membrane receptor for ferrienterochelin and colicins [Bacteroides finegoldii]